MIAQRDPDQTRGNLLQVAADEIYRVGFQAAGIGDILKKAGVSKGALYHHFPTKQDLGYAAFDEIFAVEYRQTWSQVMQAADPVGVLIAEIKERHSQMQGEALTCGCPINNLAQEMSPIDEGFRQRVQQVFDTWRADFAQALERAQKAGRVRAEVQPVQAAAFIIASVQGAIIMAKNAQDNDVFSQSIQGLIDYLEGLRC